MTRLEMKLLRFAILAAVICVILHFMLPQDTTEAPPLAEVKRPAFLLDPLQPAAAKTGSVDLARRELSFSLAAVSYQRPDMARSFGARNKEVRLILAKLNGGGEDTENAVEMALAYLARIQKENGSWSQKEPLGSTGLALNAFLGAGYHHQGGEYQETVRKGLEFLLASQKENGQLKSERMYSQAIAGMVFAEAYGLTGDPRCRKAAEKMIAWLAASQGPKGGWAYEPWTPAKEEHTDYDTSVTGWVMMAFKSAKLVGLEVPHETIDRYFSYAMLATNAEDEPVEGKRKPRWEKGMAHYGLRWQKDKSGNSTLVVQNRYHQTMTASTLMCRLYMGHDRNAALIADGLEHITSKLPANLRPVWTDATKSINTYLWYHAAQVGFLLGGEAWTFWNEPLRKCLVERQIKEGDKKGTWDGSKDWLNDRSEVYVHTVCIMILETYYRYFR